MVRKNNDGSWTIGKREVAILLFCGCFIGSAVTVGWTARSVYAQLDAKADGVAVQLIDARLQSIARDVNTLTKDFDVVVCRINPTDLRCPR